MGLGPIRSQGIRKWVAVLVVALGSVCLPRPALARLVDEVADHDPSANILPPAKLSETGLYSGIGGKARAVTAGIIPFEVNSPLWSDGAHKERWITLPPGTTVTPTDTDHYDFPDRTVLIKNFAADTVVGDARTSLLVETRFLVIRKIGTAYEYRGISYAWRRDQSDADRVDPLTGLNATLAVKAQGKAVGKRWRYPSRGDCRVCHLHRGSLGFITPQLNRPSRTNPTVNQLQELVTKGILSHNPLAMRPKALRWASLEDTTASLELRSRSYLASNCSQCHGNANQVHTGVGHNFDYLNADMAYISDSTDPFAAGPYVGKTFFDTDFPMLVYPGRPDSSYVLKRMLSRGTFEKVEPLQMPPLATYQPDSLALRVLAGWICSMRNLPAGAGCRLPDVPQDSYWGTGIRPRDGMTRKGGNSKGPTLVAGILTLPGRSAHGQASGNAGAGIRMTNLKGKAIPLRPMGSGRFAVPGGLPRGLYLVSAKGKTFLVATGY